MGLFRAEAEEETFMLKNREPDVDRILKVLDVNCLTEKAVSAKVLGRNCSGFCGIGLWILPSFVNHSCNPNARRLHIGGQVVIHASRDVKAGEEITFAYFDFLLPLNKRREMSKRWGFQCNCERCRFEEKEAAWVNPEVREMERLLISGGDVGELVVRVEEGVRRWPAKGKERGFLRASFWAAYAGVYESERLMKRWGRRIPAEVVVAESVMGAVGGDERVLKAVVERWRKGGGSCSGGGGCGGGEVEMEQRVMRLGRGAYGKVVKKQGMRALFESLHW